MSSFKSFGNKLKAIREAKNLSQQDISDLLNKVLGTTFKRNTVSNYENGASYPSIEVLRALVNILDVSADFLLDLDPSSLKGENKSLVDSIEHESNELMIWYRNITWIVELFEKKSGTSPAIEKYISGITDKISQFNLTEISISDITMTDRIRLYDSVRSLKENLIKDFNELFHEYFLEIVYPSPTTKRKLFNAPKNVIN